MKSPFPLAVHSLTRFWWDAADYLASVAQKRLGPVSYTHLTLPTIYSV